MLSVVAPMIDMLFKRDSFGWMHFVPKFKAFKNMSCTIVKKKGILDTSKVFIKGA